MSPHTLRSEHHPPPSLQLVEMLMFQMFLKDGFCAGPIFSVKVSPVGMPDKRGIRCLHWMWIWIIVKIRRQSLGGSFQQLIGSKVRLQTSGLSWTGESKSEHEVQGGFGDRLVERCRWVVSHWQESQPCTSLPLFMTTHWQLELS